MCVCVRVRLPRRFDHEIVVWNSAYACRGPNACENICFTCAATFVFSFSCSELKVSLNDCQS